MDFALLIVLNKALKVSKRTRDLFLGALISGIGGIFPYFVPVSLPRPAVIFFEYICFPFLTLLVAFGRKTWQDFFKTFGLFLGLNFLAGGCFHFLYERFPFFKQNSYQLVTFFAAFFFLCMFMKKGMEIIRGNFVEKQIYIPVVLQVGEKSISATGLMDTGNHLKEPISQKPVIIIEKELLRKEGICLSENNFFAIPYHSIGNKAGIMRGFIAEEITIGREQDSRKLQQVMIGICEEKLSGTGEYSLILNPML
ncbi:MAG: sigma-E processing peptidase SpoIIGA [Lachnospiraceae bacterium]|nr:sigma-E processing peptidase SpoIIGA [Lachnospiraceae bacterium]